MVILMSTFRCLRQVIYCRYGIRENVTIGAHFHIGIESIVAAPQCMVIGHDVYIGKYCTIECDGRIGDYVMIANTVGLVGRYDHDHQCVGKAIRHAGGLATATIAVPVAGWRLSSKMTF
jgi:UDP-3-O-[3-hydroxymyristoyl] glucosamine N-acyltransferase